MAKGDKLRHKPTVPSDTEAAEQMTPVQARWLQKMKQNPLSPAEKTCLIVEMVAEAHKVSPDDLFAKGRGKDVETPRHVAVFILKKIKGRPDPEIGRMFRGRNHTTILHSRQKVEGDMKNNPAFKKEVDDLEQKIRAALGEKEGA